MYFRCPPSHFQLNPQEPIDKYINACIENSYAIARSNNNTALDDYLNKFPMQQEYNW